MSEEQLKAFIAKAKNDQSIQEKLKAAKTPDDVIGIAKEHGHEFTADKITELSKEQLEGVAGGHGYMENRRLEAYWFQNEENLNGLTKT